MTDKQYYEKRWDEFLKYRARETERIKEKERQKGRIYREKNKEKIREQKKQYWEKNKDALNEKVLCEVCGCMTSKHMFKRHEQSKKHQNNLTKK